LPALNAVFVGDALTTYSVTTGRHAPQIAPLTADAAGAPVTRASPVERFRDGAARARRAVTAGLEEAVDEIDRRS